jgi:hypothetical protein
MLGLTLHALNATSDRELELALVSVVQLRVGGIGAADAFFNSRSRRLGELTVPVPVTFSVELDARGHVKSIDRDTPDPAAVADAARYIKTLRDSGPWSTTASVRSHASDRARR